MKVTVVRLLLGAYLALSAIELTRTLLVDRPQNFEFGFHDWETVARDSEAIRFRWTRGAGAAVLRPVGGPVLVVPVFMSHPRIPPEGVRVSLSTGGRLLIERVLRTNGWHDLALYLPVVVPGEPWLSSAGSLREDVRMDVVRALTDWSPSTDPATRWFDFEIGSSFVPAELTGSEDRRRLGLGVAQFAWSERLPDEGIGLFDWERHEEQAFRWTTGAADLPIAAPESGAGTLVLDARAPHPDAARSPVTARFYFNGRQLTEVRFSDTLWREITLGPVATRSDGVLSVRVDRIWNPAAARSSADDRDLGIGLRRTRWE